MQIPNQDFEQIKSELITLYHIARKNGDFFVMEVTDYLLQILQSLEVKEIKKKQSLTK